MTIEYHENDHAGRTVIMTACPFCGHEFDDKERRVIHLRDDCEDAPRGPPGDS